MTPYLTQKNLNRPPPASRLAWCNQCLILTILAGTERNGRGHGCDILAVDEADQLGEYEDTPKVVTTMEALNRTQLGPGMSDFRCLFILSHVRDPRGAIQ